MTTIPDDASANVDAGAAVEGGRLAAVTSLPAMTRDAWPLLASVLLLMTGSGLIGSLLGVRAEREEFGSVATGLVLSLFYLGYVVGTSLVPRFVRSVGHIRVFAALTSLASAAAVVHGVWLLPPAWMVLRFVTGLCVAGLFLVTESWLHEVSTPATRGGIIAVYNTLVTVGLASGQVLLNTAEVDGFVLFVTGSVLVSVAAVPVALAPREAPSLPVSAPVSLGAVARVVPVGLVGGSLSGIGTGTAVGFGAVYATRAGFSVGQASQFVAAVLVGGVVGQLPLGRWSDRTDRRRVMLVAAGLIAAGASVGVAATETGDVPVALAAAALLGAGSFSLYGMSFAHIADHMAPGAMAAAGAHLLRVNGLSAAAGPLIASAAMSVFDAVGFFLWLLIAPAPFVTLTVVRMFRRAAVDEAARTSYTSVPATVTIAGLEETTAEVIGIEPDEIRRRTRRFSAGRALLRSSSDHR